MLNPDWSRHQESALRNSQEFAACYSKTTTLQPQYSFHSVAITWY